MSGNSQKAIVRVVVVVAICATMFYCIPAVRADWMVDTGYSQLQTELGSGIPTGLGILVAQVEVKENNNYMPDSTSPYLAGKTFVRKSGMSSYSTHATVVGFNFYGTAFMGSGISTIDVYDAGSWIYYGSPGAKLNYYSGSTIVPSNMTERVANFSWITLLPASNDNDILRRFDYMITQSHLLAVVAANNGDSTTVPTQLTSAYNAITVGRADGLFSHGYTPSSVDGPGRIVPDIVTSGPYAAESFVTPVVSSAAAMLYQTADQDANLVNARNQPQVIKAVLMAGATKTQFPSWSRTPTRPLDTTYGAGQMNIYNSYHILKAGQFAAGSSSLAGVSGWDYSSVTSGTKKYYYFDIGTSTDSLSAILSWDRVIMLPDSGVWSNLNISVPSLELKLYSASGYALGSLVDSSIYTDGTSTNPNNVQHIYQPTLAPGRYALEVSLLSGSASYALAWGSTLTYAPGDFNHDNTINASDIDLLYHNFGSSTFYDLNNDGVVNQSDVDVLVRQILHVSYGDANLDHYVDFLDFQALLDYWQQSGGWASGDFNGDGTVDFLDFQDLLDNWNPTGAQMSPSSSSVPEPATLSLLALCSLSLVRRKVR